MAGGGQARPLPLVPAAPLPRLASLLGRAAAMVALLVAGGALLWAAAELAPLAVGTEVGDAHLFALVAQDRTRLVGSAGVSVSTLRLFEKLPRHPVVTLASVVRLLGTTKPTPASAIAGLEKAGILSETTGRQRDRVFAYASYLTRLRSGTDLAR